MCVCVSEGCPAAWRQGSPGFRLRGWGLTRPSKLGVCASDTQHLAAPAGCCNDVSCCWCSVPFGCSQVFLEETSLVARPAVPFPDLKERLEARMKWLGIKVSGRVDRLKPECPTTQSPIPRH